MTNLKRAMVSGNYYKPTGVYYGGASPTEAHRILIAITRDLIHPLAVGVGAGEGARECSSQESQVPGQCSEGSAAPAQVWVMDVHTGLGPSGVDTLASQHQEDLALLEEIFPTGMGIECVED